jgi:hypothetical protein
MKSRDTVVGHGNLPMPRRLKLNLLNEREEVPYRSPSPTLVDSAATMSKGADTADNESALLIESKGAQHPARIPSTLPLRQYPLKIVVRKRAGSKLNVR